MSEKKKCNKLYANVFCELMRTERMHKTVIDDRLTALGLHRGQHGILREIGTAEEVPGGKALSQKDVAERFGVSAAAVAMTMKKMEAEGLVTRKIAPMDNRFNELHLTEAGKTALSKSIDVFSGIDRDTFKGIDDADLEVVIRCLQKMQENLRSMPELEGKGEFRPEFNRRK